MEPPNASQTLIFILDRKVAGWLLAGCQKDYYNNDNETSAMGGKTCLARISQ